MAQRTRLFFFCMACFYAPFSWSADSPKTSFTEDGCLIFPEYEIGFDTIDKDLIRSFMPTVRYVNNPQFLSFETNEDKQMHFRQKFEPSEKGSERVIVSINLEGKRTYTLTQNIFFEEGFDWGGEKESGIIGFGMAGGSAPTGSKLGYDGFSLRLTWSGNNDGTAKLGTYLYTADRSQNLPWADVFYIEDMDIPVGEWFSIKTSVLLNSALDASDGTLIVAINDEIKIWKEDIQWQTEGDTPAIDQVLYSSFYGGNSEKYSPDSTTHVRFSDVCLSAQ